MESGKLLLRMDIHNRKNAKICHKKKNKVVGFKAFVAKAGTLLHDSDIIYGFGEALHQNLKVNLACGGVLIVHAYLDTFEYNQR